MGSELSEKFGIQVGVHQRSVLSPLVLAVAVKLITWYTREDLMNEILYANYLIIMSKRIDKLREQFLKWKETFDGTG